MKQKAPYPQNKLLQKVSQLIIVVSGVSNNLSKVYHNLTMQKVLFSRWHRYSHYNC